MRFDNSPTVLALMVSSAVSFSSAFLLWKRRSSLGVFPLFSLVFSIGSWIFLGILEAGCVDPVARTLWSHIKNTAYLVVPYCWLAFSMAYGGRSLYRNKNRMAWIAAVPIIGLGLQITELLYFRGLTGHLLSSITAIEKTWVWYLATYNLSFFLTGAIALVRSLDMNNPTSSKKNFLVVGGMALLAFGVWAQIDQTVHTADASLAQMLFALAGCALAWGICSSNREQSDRGALVDAVEHLEEGLILYDGQNRITQINSTAAQLLGKNLPELVGQPIQYALSEFPELSEHYQASVSAEVDQKAGGRTLSFRFVQ